MSKYQQQALDFLKNTNSVVDIQYEKFDEYFNNDTQKRDVYKVMITRENRSFSFNFG